MGIEGNEADDEWAREAAENVGDRDYLQETSFAHIYGLGLRTGLPITSIVGAVAGHKGRTRNVGSSRTQGSRGPLLLASLGGARSDCRLLVQLNSEAGIGQALIEWPEREANFPLSLCELRGLGAPGQRQVERCGHPLQVKTPKAVQDSLAVQRYEGHMSRSET